MRSDLRAGDGSRKERTRVVGEGHDQERQLRKGDEGAVANSQDSQSTENLPAPRLDRLVRGMLSVEELRVGWQDVRQSPLARTVKLKHAHHGLSKIERDDTGDDSGWMKQVTRKEVSLETFPRMSAIADSHVYDQGRRQPQPRHGLKRRILRPLGGQLCNVRGRKQPNEGKAEDTRDAREESEGRKEDHEDPS